MAHADKCISYKNCRQVAGNRSQGCKQEAGYLSWVMTKRLTQRSRLLSCEQWGGPEKWLKSLLSSAKFPCHFCAQFFFVIVLFFNFLRRLIITDMDSLMPWSCQNQGGKWRWPGQGAKGEQMQGESGWHRKEKSEEWNNPLLTGEK